VDDFGDDVYVSAPLHGAGVAHASAVAMVISPEVSDVSNALSWGERKGYTGREGDAEVSSNKSRKVSYDDTFGTTCAIVGMEITE
jgi:hypothetical protein